MLDHRAAYRAAFRAQVSHIVEQVPTRAQDALTAAQRANKHRILRTSLLQDVCAGETTEGDDFSSDGDLGECFGGEIQAAKASRQGKHVNI